MNSITKGRLIFGPKEEPNDRNCGQTYRHGFESKRKRSGGQHKETTILQIYDHIDNVSNGRASQLHQFMRVTVPSL